MFTLFFKNHNINFLKIIKNKYKNINNKNNIKKMIKKKLLILFTIE